MASFEYYRIFYYTAVSGSMTSAARLLHSSQPNISRCIENLEAELGTTLFHRSRRGVHLTGSGEELFRSVSPACERLEQAERNLTLWKKTGTESVSIGVSETALRIFLLSHLAEYQKTHPHLSLRISSHATREAIDSLKNGSVDFALVTSPLPHSPQLKILPLLSYREILIGGSKYRDYARKTSSLRQFTGFPFISLPHGSVTRNYYTQYFLNHHLLFQPQLEAADTDQILPMVQYNLGISFFPQILAENALKNHQVWLLPLREALPERKICLVTRAEGSGSKAADQMIQFFTQ